jgi:membrane protein
MTETNAVTTTTAITALSRPRSFADFKALVMASVTAWSDDHASSMGAAIAYYTALSLAPLLLIVIAVAGLVFGREAAQGALFDQLRGLIGVDGAQAVQSILAGSKDIGGSVVSIVVGVVVLIVGSTTVFVELQNDLDRIWHAQPPTGSGIVNFLMTRLLSFGLLLSIGFLLIVSLLATAAITALGTLWGDWLGGAESLVALLNFVAGLFIITLLFALIFKLLPRTTIAWRDVWTGASVTSVLFSIGKFAIGLYIGRSAISSSFGAAGAFVVLIVWIYYAAQVFLFGAEFTYQYALRYGSRREVNKGAAKPIA